MTDRAIKSLNGLEIGEKKVRVQRVSNDTTSALTEEQHNEPTKISKKAEASNKVTTLIQLKSV